MKIDAITENSTTADIISDDVYQRLGLPIASAHGLPGEAYSSPSFMELENKLLFSKTWVCVGVADDIESPGDVLPVSIAGAPVLLVRGAEGTVKAFHNVCRHRGNLLVRVPAKGLRKLSCPYHCWIYDLDGALKATPNFAGLGQGWEGSDFEMTNLSLLPVRVAQWKQWIFVNLDDTAPEFENYAKPMIRHLAGFDFSGMRVGGAKSFQYKANWKLHVENFFDAYHVPYIHKNSLSLRNKELYTRSGKHSESVRSTPTEGPYLPIVLDHPSDYEGLAKGLPQFSMLKDGWENRYVYLHFFPNLILFLHPDHVVSLVEEPVAVDQCRQQLRFYFAGDAANIPELEEYRRGVIEFWTMVNEEDISICETLQIGRGSPGYDGGIFAPNWERLVLEFQQLVAKAVVV